MEEIRQTAKWVVSEFDSAAVELLASELEIPRALAQLLAQRGYSDPKVAEHFLHPRLSDLRNPFTLPDMSTAVEHIWSAIRTDRNITVYGDYDVDGITSTTLMIKVLTVLGANAVPFIPHRTDDGYGLSVDTLERCIAEHGTGLMITVDCGTSSTDAAEFARQHGVDLIVTDHHEPSGEVCAAVAVVNPKLKDAGGDDWNLAGVGVAFKLCFALLKYARENNLPFDEPDLRLFLDLVALGSVADIVPLVGENRIFVSCGLRCMSITANVGLKALMDVSKIKQPLRTHHIAFQLAPRLNAAGRIGTASRALDMLLTDDPAEALVIARELDEANKHRRDIEKDVMAECERKIDATFNPETDYVIVIAGRGWHRGVVGIVASRIVRAHYRPVIVISLDEEGGGHGSGRSIAGFNLVAALEKCANNLKHFGGHAMAAGLELEGDKIDEFRERLNSIARSMMKADDLIPKQPVDAWINLEDVGEELFEAQNMLAPCGAGNPGPVWAVAGVRFMGAPREVGKGHLKAVVGIGNTERNAIGFNMWNHDLPDGSFDMAFKLEKNEFRGRVTYQMNIQDIRY